MNPQTKDFCNNAPSFVSDQFNLTMPIRRIGELDGTVAVICREVGPLAQWLHRGLTEAGLDVVLMETRQVRGFLTAVAPLPNSGA